MCFCRLFCGVKIPSDFSVIILSDWIYHLTRKSRGKFKGWIYPLRGKSCWEVGVVEGGGDTEHGEFLFKNMTLGVNGSVLVKEHQKWTLGQLKRLFSFPISHETRGQLRFDHGGWSADTYWPEQMAGFVAWRKLMKLQMLFFTIAWWCLGYHYWHWLWFNDVIVNPSNLLAGTWPIFSGLIVRECRC